MATVRQYGYYIEGNKVCIVEKDTAFDNDVRSKDYGPGADRAQWKSPLNGIVDGLEVKYVYSPQYWIKANINKGWVISTTNDEQVNAFYCPAYGEISGYLTFFFPAIVDATTKTPQHVDSGTIFDADKYILVQNHPRWNGVHKIKAAGAQGYLQTHTKWNSGLTRIEEDDGADNPVWAVDGAGVGSVTVADDLSFGNDVSVGMYFFNTTDMTQQGNEGLFKVSDVSDDHDTVYFGTQEYVSNTVAKTPGDLIAVDAAFASETFSAGNFFMPQVLLSEGAYIVSNLDVLDNEEDIIHVPSYLSKALVYYVKARVAEDTLNIDAKEYFMKEFRKMVEKYNNTRITGARMQSSGPFAIR